MQRLQWMQVAVVVGSACIRFTRSGSVNLQIQPLDAVVPAGERLVLVLSEGNAYNRLPVVPTYPMRVNVGGSASVLGLWVVNPRPAQYFDPRR